MLGRSQGLRFVALVAAAAVAIHEARIAVGFGGDDHDLVRDEQAYLTLGLSLTGSLAAAAVLSFLRALPRARRSGRAAIDRARTRLARTWATSTAALIVIYSGQELLEGAVAEGHPAGLSGIVGHSGWVALVLAVVLGALVALLMRGADAAIAWAAERRPARRPAAISPPGLRARPRSGPWTLSLLALNLAGRAPPAGGR